MDFDYAVTTINKLLIEKRPDTFNSFWIRKHAPHVYRFIQKNVRAEIGSIDWDRVTRALDRRVQRRSTFRTRRISNFLFLASDIISIKAGLFVLAPV